MTQQLLYAALSAVDILAAAAWFGAMFYSFAVLHPRARAFFASPSQFEDFISFIAAGARWKVLFGCFVIAATGLLLICFHGGPSSAWKTYMVAKAVLFAVSVAIFAYASWFAWPARVLAAPEEIPAFQRRFRFIAVSLIALVVVSFLLGILAHQEIAWPMTPPTEGGRL